MFKVETRNEGLLYKIVDRSGQGTPQYSNGIGSHRMNEDGFLTSILTCINNRPESYEIRTELDIHVGYRDTNLPDISDLVSLEITSASESQILLKKSDREYRVKSDHTQIRISTLQPAADEADYRTTLSEYKEIVQAVLNALYEGNAPSETYIIGSEIPKLSDDQPLPAFPGLPGDGDDLDELERKIELKDPEVEFADIGGNAQGKLEMERIYDDIVSPDIAGFLGRDPEKSKGYLLLGAAGNGKTLLAKALATKLKKELDGKVKFYNVNYSDITSTFRGGEAQITAKVFELVERNEEKGIKTLLFLDEIQAIGIRKKEHNEALETLLTGLDGMKGYKGLTTIGATHLAKEELDRGLYRRLSTDINIPAPNEEERKEIFDIYVEKRAELAAGNGNDNYFADIDVDKIAGATDDFNGGNIAGLMEEVARKKEDAVKAKAKMLAQERGEKVALKHIKEVFTPVTMADILGAIETYEKVERSSEREVAGFRQRPSN